ncbi:MAG: PD40 domain-containing protein [Rhodobacteraceae bacterium]|nr:PD40 domain-containing protein [Paracoccaceae bacterium]
MTSALCVYDITTGETQDILRTDRHIEAPNWTPDNAALIVNADGRLYRVPFDAPALDEIDTGFATQINNDHGVSPDGATLAICDKTHTEGSCIYTLPVGGGAPQRVTKQVPSWFHGWSPDGARMAYAAVRDGTFCICTCASDGSDEQRLTQGFDHTDGPDYTPDGAWIWFNGEERGTSNLYRMRPDGSDLEQMTDDATVDWFPHPSPNGRDLVYLAYPEGTTGHPGGLSVELRLMGLTGGPSRLARTLFGGQGTINVPSWAPEGDRFAFVHYGEHQA